jgi:alpha-1,2-mannosyltransferase
MLIALVLAATIVLDGMTLMIVGQNASPDTRSSNGPGGNDFVVFYAAALLTSEGAARQVYERPTLTSLERTVLQNPEFPPLPMAYPPFFQLLLTPLAHFDYVTAYRLWVALTVGLVIAVAWRLAPHWQTLLLVSLFPPLSFCAVTGQNGNLSAAIMGGALLLLPRHAIASGIAFGLMAYKPQLAVAIPICLLAGRHYRALAATAATAAGTVLASLIALGKAPMLAFLSTIGDQAQLVLATPQHGEFGLWSRMPTVLIAMLQSGFTPLAAWATHFVAAGAAAAALVWIWRRTDHAGLRALAICASIPLLTPYFFDYDLALFVVPFALLTGEMWRTGLRREFFAPVAALWLALPVFFFVARFLTAEAVWMPILWAALLGYSAWLAGRPGTAVASGAAEESPAALTSLT